ARFDPATGEIAGEPAEIGYPGGIAIGFGSVWVSQLPPSPRPDLPAASVARIDAASGEVTVPAIPVGSVPAGIAVDKRAVWVANEGDDTVSRIDPGTDAVTNVIPV